jgi:APA family basic amino acid/polyamine antiporter
LLDYVIFAQLMFYALTVGAVFILRVKRRGSPRSYRVWGFPWVPSAYIVVAVGIMSDLLVMRPRYAWPGLLIALSGVPVYWFIHRGQPARANQPTPVAVNDSKELRKR